MEDVIITLIIGYINILIVIWLASSFKEWQREQKNKTMKTELTTDEYKEMLYALRFKKKHKINQIKNWQKIKNERIEKIGEKRYYSQLNGKLGTLARIDNAIHQVTKIISDHIKE